MVRHNVDVVNGEPLILAIDGLVSEELVEHLKDLLRQNAHGLRKTGAYVDDMFDVDRTVEEDAHFLNSVARSGVHVPEEYREDPLRSFLWVAATSRSSLPDVDIARAADALARRAWQTQWDPFDIARSGFKKAAGRWSVPESVLHVLAPTVVQLLGAGVSGVPGSEAFAVAGTSGTTWQLRDSTVVRYGAGESQVPHVDTCDVTMLVYLSDQGGSTCFPHLGCRVPPAAGRVLLFCSTTPEPTRFGGFAGAAYGRPNDLTLHYGGLPELVESGEKLVVQLLLSAVEMGGATSWRDTLRGGSLRTAAFTAGQTSLPLVSREVDMEEVARGGLPLSCQRCASGCRDMGLDVELSPPEPKLCIYCWRKRLAESLERG